MTTVVLDQRLQNDLELLMNGGFTPLNGFMSKKDYESVLDNMHLANGQFFPLPINLYVEKKTADTIKDKVILKDEQGFSLAIMDVSDVYMPDYDKECKLAYGTIDDNHPYVSLVMERKKKGMMYVGGVISQQIQLPRHYDFKELRMTPKETKQYFKDNGWNTIVGFQTRNPMHKSHYELTLHALKQVGDDAKLHLMPAVGITQLCDIEYHVRVKCYKELIKKYPKNTALLSLYPLSMRMASSKEALLHALVRKNYGCTHFVIGRFHASPSYTTKEEKQFYGMYDAQELALKYEKEIGIKIVLSQNIVYVKELNQYLPEDKVPKGMSVMNISGTQQREMLKNNTSIPEWFSFSEVYELLQKEYNNMNKGMCLYLVGLSGAGKSATSMGLVERLRELYPERKVSVLDGDIIRQHLSKGLGFSKEDRSANVRRIGYVASEITKHGGICIVANIAPFEDDRQANRNIINANGKYIEIFVDTGLKKCEERDCKGLYSGARNGSIKNFTGISSPFEDPTNSEIVLKGENTVDENVDTIINYCMSNNLL